MSTGWRRGWWMLLVVALLAAGCSTDPGVVATEAGPISVDDTSPIPIESGVRIVTLDNGLTAYIRANDNPGGSAEMRLVIDAGSGQEDADQAGVAHFLEHMMFNGTAEFPANELVDTLRGFGMTFGADVNAYTSYDETVYELSVPTSDSDNVTTGLDVLREWLSAATLDPDEVDHEKGVVLDEWRQSDQTLDGRIGQVVESMMLGGSGYQDHSPIGSDGAIKAMTPDLLRRFYDTWYRPDNAAIMVVGDIDVDEIESQIRDRFETLADRSEATPRTDPELARFDEAAASIVADPDATTADVEVIFPQPFVIDGTVASLRHETLVAMAFDMITTRLNDDVSRGKAAFVSASVNNEGVVRWLDAPSIVVTGEPQQLRSQLDALTEELERVHRYGFDANELDRVLRAYRSSSKAQLDASDSTQDLDFISRYVDNFLVGAPVPDADAEFQIYERIYGDVTTEAVDSAFEAIWTATTPHVVIVTPDSTTDVPTADDVLARIAALPSLDISEREASSAAATELMQPPEPVTESSSDELDGDGAYVLPTMLTFPNGARVVLNPTDIADNDIYFAATSPGGMSLVADADVADAQTAVSVVTSSGIADLDPVELDTVLSDAQVELYPSIGPTSEGFSGSAATDDLELLFQLVHLYMSAPRFDQVALDATISSLRPYVENPTNDPDLASYVAFTEARYGDEPRYAAVPTADDLTSIDLQGIERVWRERFGNPADWVFALSGDFELDDGRDLARRYIGTITGEGQTEQFKDFQRDPPDTIVTEEVHAGTGDKASVTLDWSAPIAESDTESVYADVLTSVLNVRLTDHIREELGASYSPSAYVAVSTEPDHLIESYLNVTGDPEKIADISAIVIDDITDLRRAGPSPDEFDAAIAELTDTYQYFDNQTIGDLLVLAPMEPEVIARFSDRAAILDEITPITLQHFIAEVLPVDRYIEILTLPA